MLRVWVGGLNVYCTFRAVRCVSGTGRPPAHDSTPTPAPSHNVIALRGSDFYFPKNRHESEKKSITTTSKSDTAIIRGSSRSAVIDVSEPPLTPKEVECWRLDRLIYPRPLQFVLDRPPKYLFPPEEQLYSLGEEMDRIDELYRRKGRYAPSEVAHAFFPVIPSFYIELRHVFQNLSPAVAYRMERDVGSRGMGANFFSGYPMLFRQRRPTHQKSAVKLNSDFWFVRAHPFYKRADRLQYKNNMDYKAHIGGVVQKHAPAGDGATSFKSKDIDLQIFDILARHLRSSAKKAEAESRGSTNSAFFYRPVPLLQWMNSLRPEDMAIVTQIPERRVLLILSKYVRVFQLMCMKGEDPLLFTDKTNFSSQLSQAVRDAEEDDMDEDSAADKRVRREEEEDTPLKKDAGPPHTRPRAVEESQTPAPASPSAAPEAASRVLNQLDDELIGLDDILEGQRGATGEADTLRDAHSPAPVKPLPRGPEDGMKVALPARLDILWLRRLPPTIAPRSLSNFSVEESPLPEITWTAGSFLAPPPSLRNKGADFFTKACMKYGRQVGSVESELWRWVPISTIYDELTREQKRQLRPYRGLTSYLRLHGEVFEVSEDLMHVIAHDPKGAVPPFLPQQKIFSFEERVVLPTSFDENTGSSATLVGEKERKIFTDILGESQIPTTRKQIALLDPENPVLNNDVFYEEIARMLPPHPVRKRELLARLPPIMRAAVPNRGLFLNNCSKHVAVFDENGETMVQRRDLRTADEQQKGARVVMSAEAAIEAARQSIPDSGVTVRALKKMHLPSPVVGALIQHFGTVIGALEAFPQFFDVERRAGMPASDSIVRLR